MNGTPSLGGSPPRASYRGWSLEYLPATDTNPLEQFVPNFLIFAGGNADSPAPPDALPSSSTPASPSGGPTPVPGGTGDAHKPAPQAVQSVAPGASTQPRRLSGMIGAHNDSPPTAQETPIDPLALFEGPDTPRLLFAGPRQTASGLVAMVSAMPDRTTTSQSLGLERVLDDQTFGSGTHIPVSSSQDGLLSDLGISAERPVVAAGMRLVGIRPDATQYEQPPAPPLVRSTVTPTPTPNSGSYSQAGLLEPTQPAPAPTVPAGGTVSATQIGIPQLFYITGYTATGSRTATGTTARVGEVAVDPRVIPLGAMVYIEGLGTFSAEDTGGMVIGKHIDVYVNSDAEAYRITGYRLVRWTK